MTRKVYQNYITRRAQGSLGVSRQIGVHDKLYKQLYRSFGIANKVGYNMLSFLSFSFIAKNLIQSFNLAAQIYISGKFTGNG